MREAAERKTKKAAHGKTPVSGFRAFWSSKIALAPKGTDPTTRWHFSSSEGCKRPQIPMPKFYFAESATASSAKKPADFVETTQLRWTGLRCRKWLFLREIPPIWDGF